MPESEMRLSVVTVAFNSARTIGRTIESFIRQDYRNKELLVVDGASTDDTVKVVESFRADNVAVTSEPDAGIYDAMNKGLQRFSGDAVGFLNSDDRFSDDEALSAIANGLKKADIVFGNLDFVSPEDIAKVVRRWRGSPHRKYAFSKGWMPAHPTFYVRRNVVEAVGRFDLSYAIAADYDYMLRATELHDFRASFIDRVLVQMMQGGKSTDGLVAYLRSNYEAYHSRRNWLDAGVFDRAILAKPLRKMSQFLAH